MKKSKTTDQYSVTPKNFTTAHYTRYGVILADPPWSYSNRGVNGAAAKHYATLTPEAIKSLPVVEYAADNCVLVLWTTNPMIPVALDVMQAWGFVFVTAFPWVKFTGNPQFEPTGDISGGNLSWGTGFWVRGCSELILIGRRGNVRPPKQDFLGILSKRLKHSKKPDSIYEYCEALDGPYLELFARNSRPGWDSWGDELEKSIDLTRWQRDLSTLAAEKSAQIKEIWNARQDAYWEIGDIMIELVRGGMGLMEVYRLANSVMVNSDTTYWPRYFYKVALTFPKHERRKNKPWANYRNEYDAITKVNAARIREQRRKQRVIQQSLDHKLERPGES